MDMLDPEPVEELPVMDDAQFQAEQSERRREKQRLHTDGRSPKEATAIPFRAHGPFTKAAWATQKICHKLGHLRNRKCRCAVQCGVLW